MYAQIDRLLVCLPAGRPFDALLAETARFAGYLPRCSVEIVAAPAHGLHESKREFVRSVFARGLDAIHLVPAPDAAVAFAARMADRSSLIVTCRQGARRLPRRRQSSVLVLNPPVEGSAVVAVVDPRHDTTAAVMTAVDLAERLEAPRVVACHVYFDEGAAACDEWEQRAYDERSEAMHIFLSRVPAHERVTVSSLVVQSPDAERAIGRIAAAQRAALVVGAPTSLSSVSALSLPEALVRKPADPTGLRALWHRVLDGPEASPA